MAISGHKTRSVFDRYNIVNENDLEKAAQSLSAYFEEKKVTLTVTLAGLRGEGRGTVSRKVVESSAEVMELARGIEPPTCGLQNRCSAIELRQPECIGLQTHLDTRERKPNNCIRTCQANGWCDPVYIPVYLVSHSGILDQPFLFARTQAPAVTTSLALMPRIAEGAVEAC
jgi:hypothetical protein